MVHRHTTQSRVKEWSTALMRSRAYDGRTRDTVGVGGRDIGGRHAGGEWRAGREGDALRCKADRVLARKGELAGEGEG